MPEHNSAPHTFQKDGIYYFNRRVPAHIITRARHKTICRWSTKLYEIALIGLIVAAPQLSHASSSPDLTPATFGPLEIVVDDQAADGCWTNIGEAKTYAKDKLENIGYDVIAGSKGRFEIAVHSSRLRDGGCYGSVNLEIFKGEIVGGIYGLFKVGEMGGIFVGADNSNPQVLDYIRKLIDEMEANID